MMFDIGRFLGVLGDSKSYAPTPIGRSPKMVAARPNEVVIGCQVERERTWVS